MNDIQSLSHFKWRCQYHIVFAPKCRRKEIYGKIKVDIGQILRKLCEQKKVEMKLSSKPHTQIGGKGCQIGTVGAKDWARRGGGIHAVSARRDADSALFCRTFSIRKSRVFQLPKPYAR